VRKSSCRSNVPCDEFEPGIARDTAVAGRAGAEAPRPSPCLAVCSRLADQVVAT
jgi:hypothetical protein